MKRATRLILAGLFLPALAAPGGCRREASGPGGSPAPGGPSVVRPVSTPTAPAEGPRGELETIRANFEELVPLCAKDQLPFRIIENKAWLIAESAGELLRSAAFSGKLQEGKPEPDWLVDLDLISINSKRLGLAAGSWDGPGVREHFGKLELACRRLFPSASAPSAPSGSQGAGKK